MQEQQAHKETVVFCGLHIHDAPLEAIVIDIKERLSNAHNPQIVVTPNIDHLQRLELSTSPLFNESYKQSDIVLCDSRIVRILSHLSETPIKNVVPGSDLTEELMRQDWIKQTRCAIIGPSQEEFEIIKKKFSLEKASHLCPPLGFIEKKEEIEKCIIFIKTQAPEIIFLAVGSPRQEILAHEIKKNITSSAVILCIGASFDFISGKTSRAPKWIQVLNLEWLHRAFSEPKRLIPRYSRNLLWVARYLVNRPKNIIRN